MMAFRVYLVIIVACRSVDTLTVGLTHGWNLLPVFPGDMVAMTWPGQLNADFSTFLLLSGLWLAWRHQFSVGGILLGVPGLRRYDGLVPGVRPGTIAPGRQGPPPGTLDYATMPFGPLSIALLRAPAGRPRPSLGVSRDST
jgi:hypothetical protein